MKIRRIHIENFRSIKKLTFDPGNICALVGENGAGKSNILAALDFLLGERWPSSRSIDPSDYFQNDPSNTIFIGVQFEPNSSNIERYWCKFQQDAKDEILVRYSGIQKDYYVSNENREKMALVYVNERRDIDKHLRQSKWELLGRILHRFNELLPASNKDQLEQHFEQALQSLRTLQFQEFERELSSAFVEQVSHVNRSLKIDFKAFDPLSYYKSINLLLSHDGETQSLAQAGQGMRNMTIIALFRAYAKTFRGDAIMAIEEPELYLHPHAERNLAKVLREISNSGSQLFYTTHSSRFVDIEHFDEICLVERKVDDEGDLCTGLRQLSITEFVATRQQLWPSKAVNEEGVRARYHNLCSLEHSEAFFARKIVLVEGESEEYSLPIYAAALDYDFDTYGVSVVNAHGKKNLDSFYQLYHAFGIPVYLMFDSDFIKGNEEDIEYNELLLQMLGEPVDNASDGRVTPKYAVADNDFEAAIRYDIGDKQYSALLSEASDRLGPKLGKGIKARYLANRLVKDRKIPEFIREIIEAVRSLEAEEHTDSF